MAKVNIEIIGKDKASGTVKGVTQSLIAASLAVEGMKMAMKAFVNVAKESIEKFAEQEKVEKQLETVIQSTGQAAGLTAKEVKGMATELSKLTTFGDEAIIGGQNILLTFTKIGKDVFPQATETILNMSQALGQDLKSSAIQLGKALNDPITGAAALRRVGVSLTEQQMEQIKVFQESGDVLSAQRLILDELGVEFGNSARAARDTFGGAMISLKNDIGDVQEVLGEITADFIMRFSPAISAAINVIKSIASANKDLFKPSLENQKEAVSLLLVELSQQNTTYQRQKEIMNTLKNKYPALTSEMNLQKVASGDLSASLEQLAKNYLLQDVISGSSEAIKILTGLKTELITKESDLNMKYREYLTKLSPEIIKSFGLEGKSSKEAIELLKKRNTEQTRLINSSYEQNGAVNKILGLDKQYNKLKTEGLELDQKFNQVNDEKNRILNDLGMTEEKAYKKKEGVVTGTNKRIIENTEEFTEEMRNSLSNVPQYIEDGIVSPFETAGDKLKNIYADTNNAGANFIGDMFNTFQSGFADIGKTMADETATAGQKIVAVMQGVLSITSGIISGINDLMAAQLQEQLDTLEEWKESRLASVDEWMEAEQERYGVREETQTERLQREIDELNASLSQAGSAKEQAALNEQLKEKEDELKRAQILEDGENKKEQIRKKAAKKEYEEKKKAFEMNKALSIVNIWLNAASAVMGWWSAFASMGIPGVILAGVMTGTTLAMAGVQTGLVASQTFHGAEGGMIPNGAASGDRAVTYMNKGEALLRNDDYNALVSMARGSGGAFNIYGNITVVANNPQEFIEQLSEINRYEGAR